MKTIKVLIIICVTFLTVSCSDDNTEIDSLVIEEVIEGADKTAAFKIVSNDYIVRGSAGLKAVGNDLEIILTESYRADNNLPGLGLYLSNNPNSLQEAKLVDIYNDSDGVHKSGAKVYTVKDVKVDDYKFLVQWCVPFTLVVATAEFK